MTASRCSRSIPRTCTPSRSCATPASSARRPARVAAATLVGLLLSGTWATAAAEPGRASVAASPTPTSEGAKKGVVATVLSWLGFDAPKTTGALRGGEYAAMNVWIVDADKPDRPARAP